MSRKRNLLANLGVDTEDKGDDKAPPSEKPAVRRRKSSSERDTPELEALDGGRQEDAVTAPEAVPKAPAEIPEESPQVKKPIPPAKTRIQFYVDADVGERFRQMVQVLVHRFPGPSEAGEDALEVWMKANKKDFERLKEILGKQPTKRFKPGRRSS